MNNRIAIVRSHTGLTQEEFGKMLGLSRNFIYLLEKGCRIPSDRTISDICLKFSIREEWLRTGEGDMLIQSTRQEEISAFIGDVLKAEQPDFRQRLILALSRMGPEEWAALEHLAQELISD